MTQNTNGNNGKKTEELTLIEKLRHIQQELKAPKTQLNKFGGYRYRSCEDIFEAIKPILDKYNCALTMKDEIVLIGDRYYVQATATLIDCYMASEITSTAYAREEETKKGQDGSQITGASSSYARKYALNGMFLIDDVKDSDTTNLGEPTNEEVAKGTYRRYFDDYFYGHPEQLPQFLNKYQLDMLDDLDQKLTLKDIDGIITKLKKSIEQEKKQ